MAEYDDEHHPLFILHRQKVEHRCAQPDIQRMGVRPGDLFTCTQCGQRWRCDDDQREGMFWSRMTGRV